jgi:hypothetical protein
MVSNLQKQSSLLLLNGFAFTASLCYDRSGFEPTKAKQFAFA